jgi:metacaspase-1
MLRFIFSGIMLTAFLMVAVSGDAFAKDKALVIGIGKYEHARNLRGPKNDVLAITDMLVGQLNFNKSDIKVLQDNLATKTGILEAIDSWLINGTRPGDRVFIYYSGHGEQLADQSGDEFEDHMDEAIIAYDSAANHKSWLLDDEVSSKLEKLNGRQIMAIFDSCHSGSITRAGFSDANLDFAKKTPGWDSDTAITRGFQQVTKHQKEGGFIDGNHQAIAFFAVAPQQEAIDDWKSEPGRPHGVFTEAIAKGAKGAADYNHDSEVSYAELLDYTRQQSEKYCQDYMKGCSGNNLTPMLEIPASMRSADFKSFGRFSFEPIKPSAQADKPPTAIGEQVKPPVSQTIAAALPYRNDAGLRLAMIPDSRLRLREDVSYKIYSPRAGQLLVFDVSADNTVTQLFPNQLKSENPIEACRKLTLDQGIQAGIEIQIPDKNCMNFTFQAQEPIGKGKIVAILIEDAVNTKDLLGAAASTEGDEKLAFEKISHPIDTFNQLGQRLDQIIHENNGINRNGKRSLTSIDYEIIP